MTTHAKMIVQDDFGKALCVMYKHYDGYPEAFGHELARFVAVRSIVGGIPHDADANHMANGMEDLAAQIVHHFKSRSPIGDVYLYGPDADVDLGEAYTYVVYPASDDGRCEIMFLNKSDGSRSVLLDATNPEPFGG